VFAGDRAWQPGPNEAGCLTHSPAGAPGCRCGFWAYGSPGALADQRGAANVAAVVSCWGRVTPGTRGVRAEYARIDALWLSRRVTGHLRDRVAAQYPGVPIYEDRAAMLGEHPLTQMPSYRRDDPRRRSRRRTRAAVGTAAPFALAAITAVQPHLLLACYLAAFAAASGFRGARAARARQHGPARGLYRASANMAALACWALAPSLAALGLIARLVLRAPAAIWAVRGILSRTLIYLPPLIHPARSAPA
jgi:hypothetical protein